jgi:UDP-N-acetylglucosamine--N-acetylmuramyl-(pentapeptide) pyrophosphoryl-undecaprenol N-acetylglucosamine transferase
MARRIAMTVGDTAGHVLPALAIADAYREAWNDVDVTFLAADDGPARRLVTAAGYPLHVVPATPLVRVGALGRIAGVLRVVPTVALARRVLGARGVRLVIGTGGAATGGVVLAARSLGLGTAILEPNAVPGLANRLLSRVAERAYVTFDSALGRFPPGRAFKTGLPLRASRASVRGNRTPPSAERPVHLFVTGGSRGDAFLATQVPLVAARLQEAGLSLDVRHQVAAIDPGVVARNYSQLHVRAQVLPFLDDMADAYDWADMIIARAGAGTIAELALAGVPSLLVPLADAAADHQAANAAAFADIGACVWVREDDWAPDHVAARMNEVLGTPATWMSMSSAARVFATPHAARDVVADCERLMDARW